MGAELKAKKAKAKSAKAKAAKAKAAAKAKIAPKKVYRKVKVATKSPAEPKKKGQRSRQSLRQKVKAAKKDGDENDKDNKPSPIEPNNKTNAEKYKNSTPTKQSQLSDSKDNTPLTTQNTLKNRTQLMLNKQGKPNNNTKIGEQGQDGTASVLSNARVAKGSADNDDDNDSFSACILWMDDNYRLEEWLAHHYYLMKLRYVVINIDPWSKTSPQSIIDRWNDAENKYNLNMTIVTMTDSEYIPHFNQQVKYLTPNSTSAEASKYINRKTGYIVFRQKKFYKVC